MSGNVFVDIIVVVDRVGVVCCHFVIAESGVVVDTVDVVVTLLPLLIRFCCVRCRLYCLLSY